MRVGVYVDGFNLYYGARQICGRGAPGWRWLDLRALATRLVSARQDWPSAHIERVVYCTAVIDRATNPSGHADQQIFMVSYANREEKGSDVNVASHLLIDIFTRRVDAAIVLSNDSDLAYPLTEARKRVPLGTVNPCPGHLATALRGAAGDGVGCHWWRQLTAADYCACQLPNPVAGASAHYARPAGW